MTLKLYVICMIVLFKILVIWDCAIDKDSWGLLVDECNVSLMSNLRKKTIRYYLTT